MLSKNIWLRIKQVAPDVNKIIYFSDCASSQYKNKKNIVNICHHKSDFGLEAEWNSAECDEYPTLCIPKYDAFSFHIKDIG